MRKPRDLAKYIPAIEAAAFLRIIAQEIIDDEKEHPLVKLNLQQSNWNPDWARAKGESNG